MAGTVDFAGAVAVVTGGATGIGRAVCLGLVARGASAVIVNYSRSRDEALAAVAELEALGCAGRAVQADVRDETAVVAMIDAVVEEFGRIDILVNNAGATRLIPFTDLDAVTDEVWELVLGVNVRGAFVVTRAASAALRAARGAVVNVASTAGHRASGSSIAYGVSKAALLQLTRGLAVALAPEVRVNSVSPGSVNSDWMGDLVGADVARAAREAESAVIPLGRVASPEEVADAIIAMLGPGMVTGQDVIVDGGKHLLY